MVSILPPALLRIIPGLNHQRFITNYNINFDVHKNTKQTENYPSNNPTYSKSTTPVDGGFQSNSPHQIDSPKPSTFSPSAKPFSFPASQLPFTQQNNQNTNAFSSTLAPRTQQAFTQITQKTNGLNPSTVNEVSSQSTIQKSTAFTQYTPTVPKIPSTTPVSRSNRYDETQYDDGSYNSKYDFNNGDDEFLKTAHSQNIGSSRNEYVKTQEQQQQSTTQQYSSVPSSTASYPSRQTENYSKTTAFSSARNTQVT